jgi:hypothetical protein
MHLCNTCNEHCAFKNRVENLDDCALSLSHTLTKWWLSHKRANFKYTKNKQLITYKYNSLINKSAIVNFVSADYIYLYIVFFCWFLFRFWRNFKYYMQLIYSEAQKLDCQHLFIWVKYVIFHIHSTWLHKVCLSLSLDVEHFHLFALKILMWTSNKLTV